MARSPPITAHLAPHSWPGTRWWDSLDQGGGELTRGDPPNRSPAVNSKLKYILIKRDCKLCHVKCNRCHEREMIHSGVSMSTAALDSSADVSDLKLSSKLPNILQLCLVSPALVPSLCIVAPPEVPVAEVQVSVENEAVDLGAGAGVESDEPVDLS